MQFSVGVMDGGCLKETPGRAGLLTLPVLVTCPFPAGPALHGQLPGQLHERYNEAIAFGITHSQHRDRYDGNHTGYTLGCWLRDYKERVWLFTTQLTVEWTNNCSEQTARTVKRHQAVSGYWHPRAPSPAGTASAVYMDSAASYGLTALDAITRARRRPLAPAPAAT